MSRAKESGLTLIEIMISLAVLGFVLLSFMSIMSSASRFSESSREYLLAAYDLQSAVEDTLGVPYSQLTAKFPPGPTSTGVTGILNNPPSPSGHPLAKYWSYLNALNAFQNQRPLREEQVWISNIVTNPDYTTYVINIQWKTSKGFYASDSVSMLRSSR